MAKLPTGRFPFINLTKALGRAQQLYDADRGGKGLRLPLAFSAWNYSPKSSGGFQNVGALNMYGITEDEGAKGDRLLRLTPDARRYFQSEIEEERTALREKFARKPRLFAHLLDHWDQGSPPDNVARTYLKTEIGLNEQSARSALSIFKDNLEFILSKGGGTLAEERTNSRDEEEEDEDRKDEDETPPNIPTTPPKAVKEGDKVQWTSQGVDQFEVPRPVTRVFRDPERGWFVSIRGEKGAVPMEQVEVMDRGSAQVEVQRANPATEGKAGQPIEVFLTAAGRLQITADIDAKGVDTLIDMLGKYKPILALLED